MRIQRSKDKKLEGDFKCRSKELNMKQQTHLRIENGITLTAQKNNMVSTYPHLIIGIAIPSPYSFPDLLVVVMEMVVKALPAPDKLWAGVKEVFRW